MFFVSDLTHCCVVSGEIPANPVVAKVNGLLYEKSLISKYIKDTGKCPVSGASLNEEDLIEVKGKSVISLNRSA